MLVCASCHASLCSSGRLVLASYGPCESCGKVGKVGGCLCNRPAARQEGRRRLDLGLALKRPGIYRNTAPVEYRRRSKP